MHGRGDRELVAHRDDLDVGTSHLSDDARPRSGGIDDDRCRNVPTGGVHTANFAVLHIDRR